MLEFEELNKRANDGDEKALYELGLIYQNGTYVDVDYKKAFGYYVLSAKKDYPLAINKLGAFYYNGLCVEKNTKKAKEYFIKSAQLGCPKAISNIALMYKKGIEFPKDLKKSYELLKKAIKLGENNSLYNLAIMYEKGQYVKKNINKALELYDKASCASVKEATLHLAKIYEKGLIVKQDMNKCIYYLKQLAQMNDTNSMVKLASFYEYGRYVYRDIEVALYYLNKAASLNDSYAMNNLAMMYLKGEGVESDINKTLLLLKKSADLGNSGAMRNLALIYFYGRGVDVNYDEAFKWFSNAAKLGEYDSIVHLSKMYREGIGTEKDYKKSYELLVEANKIPNATSYNNIGLCYEFGYGVEQSYDKALYNYKKAADFGDPVPICNIGLIYYFGKGFDVDFKEALVWFEKGAKLNDPRSQYFLGKMYIRGNGVQPNFNKAYECFNNALSSGFSPAAYQLGLMFSRSDDDRQNQNKAFHYYSIGARSNNADCLYAMAYYYINGIVVKKNLHEALKYLQLAKKRGYPDLDENINKIKEILSKEFLHLSIRKDVFISWNHFDKYIKDELVDYLEKNNICTVWESDGSGVGNLNEIINEAVSSAKSYIVLISGNSLKSEWVEKEVTMILNIINKNRDYHDLVIPVLINSKFINDEAIYFDTLNEINKLDESSNIKKIINTKNILIVDEIRNNFDELLCMIKKAIDIRLKLEYKYIIKNKFSTFNAALTKSLKDISLTSKLITSTMEFNTCYINRPLYDISNNKILIDDLYEFQNILIYGEGGTGKTLYLQNLVNKYLDLNYFTFYISSKIICNFIYDYSFLEILKKFGFEYYYSEGYKITDDSFNDIFKDKVVIMIDALDELDNDNRNILLNKIKFFENDHLNIKFIFTSRNKEDLLLLNNKLSKRVKIFKLEGINDDDISKIFDNITNKVSKCINPNVKYMLPSKNAFFASINNLSKDIRHNPLLLSNLIFVYIISRKLPDKKFAIINEANKLLINNLEEERDLSFKYYDYIEGNKLDLLLEYLAFNRTIHNNKNSVDIFTDYLNKFGTLNENDNPIEIANSLYDFLSRRSILIDDNIAHQIFNDYYAACYIFNNNFTIKDTDWGTSYVDYIDENKFKKLLESYLSLDEEPWLTIGVNLLTKIDFEIYNTDTKMDMNELNDNYNFYNNLLTTIFTSNSKLSKKFVDTIFELASKKLLYYNDYILNFLQ